MDPSAVKVGNDEAATVVFAVRDETRISRLSARSADKTVHELPACEERQAEPARRRRALVVTPSLGELHSTASPYPR